MKQPTVRPGSAHPDPQRLFTFASGGWVLVAAALICVALVAWAIAPALLRLNNPPLGDGANIESYGFDLSNLQVPRDLVAPGTRYRDMVPVMSAPAVISPQQATRAGSHERPRYLVPGDRVVGVAINGEARAYPLAILNVHEIINDMLGGVPIAVTYHPLCDSVVVFDRRFNNGVLWFGSSGLVLNSNMLMYERWEKRPDSDPVPHPGGQGPAAAAARNASGAHPDDYAPSLWSQLLGTAVCGPLAGSELAMHPSALVRWADWLQMQPQTTIADRDPAFIKRYEHADPAPYFRSRDINFPVRPLGDAPTVADAAAIAPPDTPAAPAPKDRVLVVAINEYRRVYPIALLADRAQEAGGGTWTDQFSLATLHFRVDTATETVVVTTEPPGAAMTFPSLWFAWHAMHPQDPLVQ